LPKVAHLLHASEAQQKLAFPLLLLGSSFNCFFVGALADFFGAKKVMVVQMVLVMIGTCICLNAYRMDVFLLGCFVQGLGIFSVALIKYIELYEPERAPRFFAVYFFLGCACIPVVMILSGYLCHYHQWASVFWFWFLAILLALLMFYFLPRLSANTACDFKFKDYFCDIASYWRQGEFYAALVSCMSIGGAVAVFYTLSPHIIIHDFHHTSRDFGFLMILPIIGRLVGNGLYFFLSNRISIYGVIAIGKWVSCLAMLLYVVAFHFFPTPVVLMAFVGGVMLAYPLIRTSSFLRVMSINPLLAGSALSFLALGVKTVKGVSGLFAARQDGEMMGLLMLVIVVVGALIHTVIHRFNIRCQKNP